MSTDRGGGRGGERGGAGRNGRGSRRPSGGRPGSRPPTGRAGERRSGERRSGEHRSEGNGPRAHDRRGGTRGSGGDPGRKNAGGAPGAAVDPVRAAARDTLRAVRERDAYANLVLPGLLRERSITGRDAALATEITYGACRTLSLLDAVIAACAGRGIDDVDPPVLDALRVGVYQLLRTRVAAHAAVSTAVGLVRAESSRGAAGFANAVLRRVAEQDEEQWVEQLAPSAAGDPVPALAFRHTHPVWIARAFADALGPDASELPAALAADNVAPQVHLAARPGAISAEELALVSGGSEGHYSPYAVYLDAGDPGELEAVRDGLAAVQDEGSQLVARAATLAPVAGADAGRWLDLCAGPGGKAVLLGALAEIEGARVDAVEPAEHRAALVRTAVEGLPVRVHTVDGCDSGLEPGFDRVLVDAPCTGLGALRRRPEARWRKGARQLGELTELQSRLVDAAAGLVRPGGVLIYATCSPHIAETVSIVADAERRHGMTALDARELLPDMPTLGAGPHVQMWPHRHGTDGMFLAVLRKQ